MENEFISIEPDIETIEKYLAFLNFDEERYKNTKAIETAYFYSVFKLLYYDYKINDKKIIDNFALILNGLRYFLLPSYSVSNNLRSAINYIDQVSYIKGFSLDNKEKPQRIIIETKTSKHIINDEMLSNEIYNLILEEYKKKSCWNDLQSTIYKNRVGRPIEWITSVLSYTTNQLLKYFNTVEEIKELSDYRKYILIGKLLVLTENAEIRILFKEFVKDKNEFTDRMIAIIKAWHKKNSKPFE